ncbi:OmpA family protein [Fulvivirgaceae bacterium BMA10]|uniref:OmpA family protein n=1 Tax=Splendidivirga corallicola TaxID=3051826 RepID=A0ABT8KR12_9BACT|nr:OmpA family protein [Fulvivirgaceae bacterium BMA10]
MLLRNTIALVFACLISCISLAQEVLWATNVIEFSSELSPVEYSANQALHKPNVYPVGGENPNAWLPKKSDRIDFIKVGFEKPTRVQQIAVAESMNPSAVKEVYAYDAADTEYKIFDLIPEKINVSRRILNIFIDRTSYDVHAIKIVLDGKSVDGYNSIDAIGIADSKEPIKIEVNLPEDLNTDLKSERLNRNVNSSYPEIKPLVSPDGQILYFSRQNHPENTGGQEDKEDIWYSEKDNNGEWTMAKNIGAPLNNEGPNFISSITPDGNTAVILLGNRYEKSGKMKAGVSVSTRTSEGWTEPTSLNIENDYNLSKKVGYYLANNRKILLMSVQRDDTRGGRDLYVSFQKGDNTWTEPKSLGDDINTANEEHAPFLAADDKTLYFSSKGFSGYGGDDIYVSRRLDDTWLNWSEPENLGPSVNSENDDQFFNVSADGEQAFFSRSVGENDADIFDISLPELFRPTAIVMVKGKVFNRKTQEPVSARIFYESLPAGEEIGTINSDPVTGEYQILLPSGARYGYLAEAEGFVAINENIDLDNTAEYKEIEQNLFLVPVETGAVIRLNNIFFDFDKSTLKEESFPELNRIADLLKDKATMEVELAGHTDNIGSKAYNQRLSERRAKAVFDYLVNQGVNENRLTTIGYGKDRPIASNDDEEDGRELNRRVEFKILKE